jgi:tRNA A-37 threonylcarbamoyl transferase component Bud32
MMTAPLFCDQCGATLPGQAPSCAACGYHVAASSSPSSGQATPLHPTLPASAGPLPSGFLLAQRYRILKQIGQGGFATVYKAKDLLQKNKPVAIKQINVGAFRLQEMIDAADAYNREVIHLSKLRHENLPRIYDHFTDADHWYVVMEYIEGQTLEDILNTSRRRFFPVKRVLDIGITLCNVLRYLHSQRPSIIFRDIKPANIMITRTGRLCLIDFGIARHYRPGQRKDTSPLGSPGYAAPEQYGLNAQSTPQTDVYGLGATLQTLLTGKEPLELLLGGLPDQPIPQELQGLLTLMLERDTSKRLRSIDEVEQELQRLKDRLFGQKMKHMLGLIWQFLKSFFRRVPMLLLMLFSLSPLIAFQDFFDSPFWTLYLFIAPIVMLGNILLGLHREMRRASSRLNLDMILAIVGNRLWNSLLHVWILLWISVALFYWFYFHRDDISLLGLAALISIVCIILAVYWGRIGIRLLQRMRTSLRQTYHHAQSAPLQQQVHKHP